jgi:hypothetical protein
MNILPEHKLLISDVRQNGSGPDKDWMCFRRQFVSKRAERKLAVKSGGRQSPAEGDWPGLRHAVRAGMRMRARPMK